MVLGHRLQAGLKRLAKRKAKGCGSNHRGPAHAGTTKNEGWYMSLDECRGRTQGQRQDFRRIADPIEKWEAAVG
jgi:hypothetical protein